MLFPRMTTRRWLIAVAVVGLVLALRIGLQPRAEEYQARAFYHIVAGYPYKYGVWPESRIALGPERPVPSVDPVKAAFHEAMASK